MKHEMKIAATLFLLGNVINSQAQTERVQLNFGHFFVPSAENEHFLPPLKTLDIRQVGASYTHHFNGQWALRGTCNYWFSFGKFKPAYGNGYYNKLDFPYAVGDVLNRYDYSMIDFSAIYQKHITQRHEIYAATGLSYAWGRYIEITKRYNEPGYPDWLFESESRKAKHLGLMAEFGYNYLLKNNRVNIGVSESIRAYNALPIQLYLNFNIGYNFNWMSSK